MFFSDSISYYTLTSPRELKLLREEREADALHEMGQVANG